MTLKGEAIIDGLAGLPKSFTDELNELKAELYDSQGNPIKPEPENMDKQIQKANRYTQMLQERNELWTAKLN
jgi:hypothetical protein